jgi:hypothetical protein
MADPRGSDGVSRQVRVVVVGGGGGRCVFAFGVGGGRCVFAVVVVAVVASGRPG